MLLQNLTPDVKLISVKAKACDLDHLIFTKPFSEPLYPVDGGRAILEKGLNNGIN